MTRKPKNKRFTELELKAISPDWAGDTLSDGDGLRGEVRRSGDGISIRWRWGYKWEGRLCWFQCGTWPVHTMAAIRDRRADAAAVLAKGVNPSDQVRADKAQEQLQALAAVEALKAEQGRLAAEAARNRTTAELVQAWLSDGVARKDGNAALRRSFEADVLPVLGARPLRLLNEDDIRRTLRRVTGRGADRSAVMLLADLRQMLRWAGERQPWRALLTEGNPAALVEIKTLVSPGYDLSNERDRVLSDDEVIELWRRFEAMDAAHAASADRRRGAQPVKPTTQCALWLCLATLCRIGELLQARWEHMDRPGRVWFIPAANTKGQRGKQTDHQIHLSDFALSQLDRLHALTGATPWLFPARAAPGCTDDPGHVCLKSVSKQVGDRQTRFKDRKALSHRRNDDTLVLSGGEWTPHDLRRTGATLMQRLGVLPNVIDFCQHHVLAGPRTRRHYLHHQYTTEMADAWDRVGAHLSGLVAGKLIPFRRRA